MGESYCRNLGNLITIQGPIMKCVFLFLYLTSICYAAEDTVAVFIAKESRQVSEESTEAGKRSVGRMIKYGAAHYAKVSVPVLGGDPKHSEVIKAETATDFNKKMDLFNSIAEAPSYSTNDGTRMEQILLMLETGRDKLKPLGITMLFVSKDTATDEPVKVEKNKPKPKITATLSDGTVIK